MAVKNSEIFFGTIAIKKGYVTGGQLGRAVTLQMREDIEGGQKRLLGEILIEMGYMSTDQVQDVLESQLKGR
ncbi:MAG: hypothetical protein ABII26_02135 [Pseudomonadota bacterium]